MMMNCRPVVGNERRVAFAHVSVTKPRPAASLDRGGCSRFLAFHCGRPSAPRGNESEAGISEKTHKKPSELSMAAWGRLGMVRNFESRVVEPSQACGFSCRGSGGRERNTQVTQQRFVPQAQLRYLLRGWVVVSGGLMLATTRG